MHYIEQLNTYTEAEYQRLELNKNDVMEILRNVEFTNNDVFRAVLASGDEISNRILKNIIGLILQKEVIEVKVEKCDEKRKYEWAEDFGYEKGEKSGLAKGIKQGRQEIIKAMIENGVDISLIAKYTECSVDDIQQVLNGNTGW